MVREANDNNVKEVFRFMTWLDGFCWLVSLTKPLGYVRISGRTSVSIFVGCMRCTSHLCGVLHTSYLYPKTGTGSLGRKYLSRFRDRFLVKPLVVGIKFGKDNNQNLHATNRAMPCSGAYHDTHAWMYFDDLVVKLHLGVRFTFQKVIGLGQSFVVVKTRVRRDLRDMDRTRKVLRFCECTSRRSAGAFHSLDFCKVDDLVASLAELLSHEGGK